jgi:histidyl-tRNA synthetase
MRVLDCKVPACRETLVRSPVILEYLCQDCQDHFSRVKKGLSDLEAPFEVDPRIVRGLDYYNRTAFEAVCGRLGAQDAVAAGGRYDGLAGEIGGEAYGIGFAIGLERLTLVMDWDGIGQPAIDYYIASATDNARVQAMRLADTLRGMGYAVETDVQDRSLKAQLKSAGKTGVLSVLILGEDELASGTIQVKNFASGEQETVDRKEFLAQLNRQG